jgi:8-oxo-dGTP pyrophosphatase MutT (NUDIX family)
LTDASATHASSAPKAAKPHAVRPRHAATILLWRQSSAGPEVLMGVRNAGHRFMPNKLVFPGGRVDRADYSAAPARPLAEGTRTMLEHAAPPRLAQALGMAAVRELFEETGLVLGSAPPAGLRAQGSWASFLATGLAPDLSALDYLCRAVTPPIFPMRFNARFLVAPFDAAHGTLAGNGELEFLRFMNLDEARGLEVPNVTRHVLEEFSRWLALAPESRAGRSIPLYEPARNSPRGKLRL